MEIQNIPMLKGYEIRGVIAERGDKCVYLVVNGCGELRVLKVLKRTYKYPIYESLSRLIHVNMSRIYGTTLTKDCFYVLEEFIEGRTLQQILEIEGAFAAEQTVEMILQLCDVLSYLHNQSPPIIHRDITPANIILTNEGVVKLLDFDISREHKKDAAKDTEIYGTKPFAPPEQYGFAQSDHKTDIYALGVLMTVLLTNTYDTDRIKNFRIKAVVKRCNAFDPKKRYEDVKKLKNRMKLCVSPHMLLQSITSMDTNIYVFAHARLKMGRMAIPVIALYISILALSFIQPRPADGYTANDAQYRIFLNIAFAVLFTFLGFILFALYDIFMFYYLRALQRYYSKRDASRKLGRIPFVIASKKYVHCTLALISVMGITCSLPFTDIWETYDINGVSVFFVILCIIASIVMRGSRYPKCYNKAVRCYYKGNMKKAADYARKSSKCKRNHAKAWLLEILKAEEETKISG